ncbi:RluA family pseudouridine synthase [Balneolaceae bacterium YR4-1]|uniref:RluA family pseudouridine synthase n=1 Tax=Halalkalibaculum roseum TaxID=2709311 RepID=A0A6M1T232_9BACT|nr:RluA family pseudouridine synthase [Halalkalibaculum roseum]NGP77584.1 RluA family pseudouridine synthase [Halalkalibaculum roseum]
MAAKDEYGFSVVYEDDELFVIDKPAGMLAVPIPNSSVMNMLDLVKERFRDSAYTDANTAHRIDRYTSGLMVFAKTGEAYDHLFYQFKNHLPKRSYLAIIRGLMSTDSGELNHYLKLVKEGFRNIVVDEDDPDATPARLTYKVLERFLSTSLVQVNLDTGLKNQIRVQFNAIGHSLVGDRHYAPEEKKENLIKRQALHAWKISITHPATGKEIEFTADLPADMLRLVDHYRWERDMRSL